MLKLGAKVKAKSDYNYGIKKGQEFEVTSKASDHCVLDGRFLLSILDLNSHFCFVV